MHSETYEISVKLMIFDLVRSCIVLPQWINPQKRYKLAWIWGGIEKIIQSHHGTQCRSMRVSCLLPRRVVSTGRRPRNGRHQPSRLPAGLGRGQRRNCRHGAYPNLAKTAAADPCHGVRIGILHVAACHFRRSEVFSVIPV
jgi:hypothetical protein